TDAAATHSPEHECRCSIRRRDRGYALGMVSFIDRLLGTAGRTVHVLQDNGIPCALTGDCAMYARGGPAAEVGSEVDVLLRPADLARGLRVLAAEGLRSPLPTAEAERTTLYDNDIRVDLVVRPNYRPVTDELLARAEALPLRPAAPVATSAPVVTVADFLVDELTVADPHRLDFTRLLHITRELRAQVDWERVWAETAASPYARAFLGLLDDLGVSGGRCEHGSTEV
ncbi:nucleotidyltransferase family protein, partial [Nocardia seriolae]